MSHLSLFVLSGLALQLLSTPAIAGTFEVKGLKDPRIRIESLTANYDAGHNFFCPTSRKAKVGFVDQTPEVYATLIDYWSWSMESALLCWRPHDLSSVDLRMSLIDPVTNHPRNLFISFKPHGKGVKAPGTVDIQNPSAVTRAAADYDCGYRFRDVSTENLKSTLFIEQEARFSCDVREGSQTFVVDLQDWGHTIFELDIHLKLGPLEETLLQKIVLPSGQNLSVYANADGKLGVTSKILFEGGDESYEALERALFPNGNYRVQTAKIDPLTREVIELGFVKKMETRRMGKTENLTFRLFKDPTAERLTALKSGCANSTSGFLLEVKRGALPSQCWALEAPPMP